MVPGRMMVLPLTITHLLERTAQYFGRSEVVSVRPDKSRVRTPYAEIAERCRRLASALKKHGVKEGDRVATLCWNHREHLEAYLAVPSMGAVVHTLNLRLHPTELGYIAGHAEDKVVIVDRTLLPLFDKFKDAIKSLELIVIVDDCGPGEGKDDAKAISYDKLLAEGDP